MSSIRFIPAASLRVGMYVHKLGGSWLDHPFLRNRFLLDNPEDLQRILETGISEVWIDESKGDPLQDLETIAGQLPAQDARDAHLELLDAEQPGRHGPDASADGGFTLLSAEFEQARKICIVGKEQIRLMFDELRLGNTIRQEAMIPLVEEISASVWRNPAALISVARLKTHDDYSYLHSVAVSALMLALARQLGLDEAQTRLAGIGGLMHDLGKAFMPLEVLNKPGRLTDEEFELMKTHSARGAAALAEADAPPEVLDIILHHHERMDGRGYPHALPGQEISMLARMAAICDVYDAVTSVRPYKQPWDPAMAMREMARWEGQFDPAVFNAFVKSVGIYPVGALVRLASEKLAVVAEPGKESLLKPKVRVFYSLRKRERILMHTLDLAEPGCKDSIIAPENPKTFGFTNLEALWL